MRRHVPTRPPWQSGSPPLGSPGSGTDSPPYHLSPATSPAAQVHAQPAWPAPSSTSTGKPQRPTTKRTNSGGNAVLSAIGLASPSLKIRLQEDVLFLHPTAPGLPSDDPLLVGSVTLYLPKPRTLKKLTVRLSGRQDIGWPDNQYPYESQLVLDKTVSLFSVDGGVHLEKGEHTFAFSILVPSSTPTYERCPHGRVRHIVTARAKGLGPMHSDVVSEEKPITLIANPGGPGASRPPPPLDYRLEGLVNDLGPYTMTLRSNHLMVGGLLWFRFKLVSPPTDIVIHSIKVRINQHFKLISHGDPNKTAQPPVDKRTIILLDSNNPANEGKTSLCSAQADKSEQHKSGARTPVAGPLCVVAENQEFSLSHLGRIPNDNVVRPTTQEGTDSGIRVSHEIAVEVMYRPLLTPEPSSSAATTSTKNATAANLKQSSAAGQPIKKKDSGKEKSPPPAAPNDRERKKMTVTKPIEIFSCCCFVDSLTLPMYSEKDPSPEQALPCVCDYSTEQMLGTVHGLALMRDDTDDYFYDQSAGNAARSSNGDANGTTGGPRGLRLKSEDERLASSASATHSSSYQGIAVSPTSQSNAPLALSPPLPAMSTIRGNASGVSGTYRTLSSTSLNHEYGSTDETIMTVAERLGQL